MIDCGLASYMQAGQVEAGQAAVEHETEGRTRAAEYLMQNMDWDLLVVVYSLPDVWQHYYWAALRTSTDATGRDLIYAGYRMLDRHLARLLAHLPPGGVVIVCSDHGFGPLCGTRDHINRWLAGQGLLRYREDAPCRLPARIAGTLLAQARRRVSFRLRQQLMASVPILRRIVETQLRIGGIDWARTQVYAALDHQELWVNLAGRQPDGCVTPAGYDVLCQRVAEALLAWHDEQNGQHYITAVHHRPYSSAHVSGCLPPDLSLEWNAEAARPGLHPLISGDHFSDGALILAGAGVRAQRLPGCSLADVAPMALRALGLPIPEYMDGRVPPDLFDEARDR
jgi:predicted AlkP superfamily phosphohydrolase/phosphomutase